MDRGTDSALIADSQPNSDNEVVGPVRVSVEAVGQLVVPRDGTGPALYLPNLGNLAKATESMNPTLQAFTKVSTQISRMGLKTLGRQLAQWRKIQNTIIGKRLKVGFPAYSRLEKILRRYAVSEFRKFLSHAKLPQLIGSFIQQVFDTDSLMLTGPPFPSTGLPINNSVTTWGRVT